MLNLEIIQERAKDAIPDPVWTGDALIIDGKNLVHRLASREANSESAAAVVIEKLTFLREWYKPDQLIVGWEGDGTNWRFEHLPEYKGHRNRESEVSQRVDGALEILDGLLPETIFAQMTTTNAEGDDVFGTLAAQLAAQGLSVAIYSNDGDLRQLVTDKISIIVPQSGDRHDLLVTPDFVRADLGLGPSMIADLKGLMGDGGDNIPGVKGVGPKVALELISKHGSFEAVLSAAQNPELDIRPVKNPESEIKSERRKESKAAHAKRVREEFGATPNKLSRIRDQESLARASFEAGKIRRDVELIEIPTRVTLTRMLHDRLRKIGASDWLLSRVDKIVRHK